MIARLLHRDYKRAVSDRLSGRGPTTAVPYGGETQRRFTRALFVVMGRLAKLDGRVSEAEVRFAAATMTTLGLDAQQRQQAIDFFYAGKQTALDVSDCVAAAVRYIGARSPLARVFLKTQCLLAFSKGVIRLKEKILLREVAEILGFDKAELLRIYTEIQLIDMPEPRGNSGSLSHAYRLLQLPSDADDRQIRRAYRRQMARYHPDKLAANQLSGEALRRSQERFVAVRHAYETITGFRKMPGL